MTVNHDHATLFVAPAADPTVQTAGRRGPAVDDGAEAMRRLRHPFTAGPAWASEPAESLPPA